MIHGIYREHTGEKFVVPYRDMLCGSTAPELLCDHIYHIYSSDAKGTN